MNSLAYYFGEAARSLWLNRLRVGLALVGLVIGTAAVVTVLGISQSTVRGITVQFASFGPPAMFANADPDQTFPGRALIQYRDAKRVMDGAAGLLTEVEPWYSSYFHVKSRNASMTASVVSSSGYPAVDTADMASGRAVNQDDVARAAHVCVLSTDIARHLFGDAPALGQLVSVNGTRFEVIGVSKPLKGDIFNSLGAASGILLPYSTYHNTFQLPANGLIFYPAPEVESQAATHLVESLLQKLHGKDAKYVIQDTRSIMSAFKTTLSALGIGLTAVGAVALLVAGMGITNIMLVSVAERTYEIGIRRTIGATQRDIFIQFLLEASTISVLGGTVGLCIGVIFVFVGDVVIRQEIGSAPAPYLLLSCIAISFSLTIGLLSGLYPALRASRMDPAEAIRS